MLLYSVVVYRWASVSGSGIATVRGNSRNYVWKDEFKELENCSMYTNCRSKEVKVL